MLTHGQIRSKLTYIGEKYGTPVLAGTPFKSRNFITNSLGTIIKLPNGLYVELSFGRGIWSDFLYGATTMTFDKDYTLELGGCCHTFEEVEEKVKAASEFVVDKSK